MIDIRFKFRLIIDETYSWGVLGATGKGLTEHFNLPVGTIDVLIGAMDTTMASIGGFCVGK